MAHKFSPARRGLTHPPRFMLLFAPLSQTKKRTHEPTCFLVVWAMIRDHASRTAVSPSGADLLHRFFYNIYIYINIYTWIDTNIYIYVYIDINTEVDWAPDDDESAPFNRSISFWKWAL